MHASAGVHAGPKWKHVPPPPLVHVKYAPAPAWKAQLGAGHPSPGAEPDATPPEPAPTAAEPAPVPFAGVLGPDVRPPVWPPVVGPGFAGCPHATAARTNTTVITAAWRTVES